MQATKLDQLLGWIGTAVILAGYFLLSLGVFGNDWRYHLSMLVGSAGVAWVAYRTRLWQVVALNGTFIVFAAIALVRIIS